MTNAGDVLTFSVDIYTPDTDGSVATLVMPTPNSVCGISTATVSRMKTLVLLTGVQVGVKTGIQSLGGNAFAYTVTGNESRIEFNVGFMATATGAMFIDNASSP